MRTHAAALCRKGKTFVEALEEVVRDPVLKERHLSTPMAREAVESLKRTAPPPPAPHGGGAALSKKQRRKAAAGGGSSGKGGGGNGGGGSRSSGKGQGKASGAGKGGCRRSTPDGKPICFRYNSPGGCSNSGCKFLHVCGSCCATGHSIADCPAAK